MRKTPEEEALDRILGDMDDREGVLMTGADKPGITITITPHGGGPAGSELPSADEVTELEASNEADEGAREHGEGPVDVLGGDLVENLAVGGVVGGDSISRGGAPTSLGEDEGAAEEDAKKLPPFLRKKRKPLAAE